MVEVDEHHFGLDPGQLSHGILHDGMGYLRINGPPRNCREAPKLQEVSEVIGHRLLMPPDIRTVTARVASFPRVAMARLLSIPHSCKQTQHRPVRLTCASC